MTEKAVRVHGRRDLPPPYPPEYKHFYECQRCGEFMPSRPSVDLDCVCGNLHIAKQGASIRIEDPSSVEVFHYA